ncbi:hypothetical protein GGS23DRAFT_613112 [Durotheca rogersii]|uniref:uncharacterized protein n=1 Tax=Durotheca rogersii TaxID=419775 RepID=UPI0022212678|nr:uncharacterized protein GGS23DRAFT_613112 [Durotheca rogersii]KAI5860986.1 hypothetical protein GGS23DRAFT_613112 [Durotheca rogersii]
MAYDPDQAQIVGYVCGTFSLIILVARLGISRWRRESIDLGFFLVSLSILTITGRLVMNEFYLKLPTANDVLHNPDTPDVTSNEALKVGGILVLLARVLLTAALWLQIGILLVFYARITSNIFWVRRLIWVTWIFVGATFVAVVLATFLECQPIDLYWQIEPNPGQCVRAYLQLLIQAIANIIADIMLLVIAYPLMRLSKRSLSQTISIYTLFALGTFCMVITIIRIVLVFSENSSQTTRSLWASVQMLVACFVANAPTIYGSLRVVQRKRSEQRSARGYAEPMRRPSRPERESWIKMTEQAAPPPQIPVDSPTTPPPILSPHHDNPYPATRLSTASSTEDKPHSVKKAV